LERLQKILAEAGYGSRRKVEKLIIEGVVTVNGQVAELGQKASRFDDIRVKGEKIILQRKVYYLLNKPEGYLCTLHDPFNRPKVTDLVPQEPRVFPVAGSMRTPQGLYFLQTMVSCPTTCFIPDTTWKKPTW